MPALLRLIRDRYAPLAILAGASLLAACSQPDKADQAAASDRLHQAGSDLKSAAQETAGAIGAEADAAKPALKHLARDADRGAAKLAADTGTALDQAGRRADQAAHHAAADARAAADNAQR